jgi:hypothetical protein
MLQLYKWHVTDFCCEVQWCGMNWRDLCEVILFWNEEKWSEMNWSEVEWSYVEVLEYKSTMHIKVTLYSRYLIVLWLFRLVCILYCGCFNLFCNMWFLYIYICVCVCVCVCVCGFCNVWVCVYMSFVLCGSFDIMCTCIYCVYVLFLLRILNLFIYFYLIL